MIAERDVEAPGPLGPLRGVMTSCGRADAPLALLYPGSGPTDRDGNNPLGLRGAPYRLLAHALALHGVDVARVDKRGLFASAAAGDPDDVTLDAYAQDLAAWMDALGPRRPVLIGHSEGGLSVLAAALADARARGLVLIATPGRKLGQVLRAQLAANPANAPLIEAAFVALDALEAGRRIVASTTPAPLRRLFAEPVQGFLQDLLSRDPVAMLAAATAPTLIVHGGRDRQVTTQDANRLAAARPDVARADFPAMTHALKDAASDLPADNLATYAREDLPLTPGLAERVAGFIHALR